MMNTVTWDRSATVTDLEAIKTKLNEIDQATLSGTGKLKLADDLNDVSVAILKLNAAELSDLNEEFKQQAPQLQKAAADLKQNLDGLQSSIDIVNTVAAGLGVVMQGVNLLT